MAESNDFQELLLANILEIKTTQKQQADILNKNTQELADLKTQFKLQNGRVNRLEASLPEVKADLEKHRDELIAAKKQERDITLKENRAMNQRLDKQDAEFRALRIGQEQIHKIVAENSAIFGGEEEFKEALRSIAAEQQINEWKKKAIRKIGEIVFVIAAVIPATYYFLHIL
jgi:hypothetical protein